MPPLPRSTARCPALHASGSRGRLGLSSVLALAGLAGICAGGIGTAGPARAQAPAPAVAAPDEPAPAKGRRGRRERASKTSSALPPGMQKAEPLLVSGDWNVYANGQGREKICYVIAQPQSRVPKTLARDTAYLFVTLQKSQNVQNEIAVMFGFKPKPAASQAKPGAAAAPSDPYLTVGASRYGLVVKDENAWVQNQAEEARIVAELSRGQVATVKTTSLRNRQTSDEYALGGFAQALQRAREECK